MGPVQKELLKTVLKIEEKDDKLLVTVGAPKYAKGGKKVKVNADELGYILQLQGKYKNIVSVLGGTYVNFWNDYKEEVLWVYTYETVKKSAPKKSVAKKKIVPKKETPKPTEG
tara:strand:+ start:121 stop:459 length:339 start_codon:yes stop_codon:yes gene_type:complete